MAETKTVLMCSPDYFDIEYEINPWMHQENQPSDQTAHQQWDTLYDIYAHQLGWDVELIEPIKGLPDMVFATDCCLMIGRRALLSSFRYPERQPETQYFEKWLRDQGYTDLKHAENFFEGGGDNMLCGDKILAGYGFRSSPEAADEMREFFNMEVVPLRIVDENFYHLDTSLAVLGPDTVAFYPGAIDEDSQQRLREAVPNVIEATAEEARSFGLNAVSNGKKVVTSDASESLLKKYEDAGFETVGTPILEFRKAGGGVKCLTLELRG